MNSLFFFMVKQIEIVLDELQSLLKKLKTKDSFTH